MTDEEKAAYRQGRSDAFTEVTIELQHRHEALTQAHYNTPSGWLGGPTMFHRQVMSCANVLVGFAHACNEMSGAKSVRPLDASKDYAFFRALGRSMRPKD